MSIRNKLSVLFLLIALIPAVSISIYSINTAQTALKQGIGENIQGIAFEKASAIARVLSERIHMARHLAAHPAIIAAVGKANRGYLGRDEDEILKTITGIDREWIASDRKSPEAKDRGNNSLAVFLKSYHARNQNKYGEIFVTDRRGATVAMTKPLTDFYQADEEWWSEAFNMGKGSVFIDDRGYDSSVNSVVVGVVVPVKDKGEITGILKINYQVDDILNIVSQTQGEKQTKVILARSRGTIIMDSKGSTGGRLNDAEMAHINDPEATTYFIDEHQELKDGKPVKTIRIGGHSPVDARISTRLPVPGAIKGVSGEHWEPVTWHVFVEVDQEVAFAIIDALQRRLILVVVAVMLAVALLAYWMARSIANPILILRQGAEIIAAGNLDHKVGINSTDEIGGLSRAFDRMTARLGETLASRDERIAAHKRAEKKILKEQERANEYLAIAEAIIVCLDRAGRVTLINRRGLDLLGYEEDEIIGVNWFETVIHKAQVNEVQAVHAKVCSGEIEPVEYFENEVLTKSGERRCIYWHNTILKDDNGVIIGSLSSGQDVTERKLAEEKIKASLSEKEVLLQEIHHRVKNNLQVISSMLALQARAEGDERITKALLDSERRVRVMAQVHENLYRSDDLARIDARSYLKSIADDVKESQLEGSERVLLNIHIDEIILDIEQAIPIGQIVSELLSNAVKHAFPDGRSGTVELSFKRLNGGDIELSVADDGIGMPEDIDIAGSRTLGLQLIDTLSMMIKGELIVSGPPGTCFKVVFKGDGQ
ncbi:MAG: histidine kinase dimerization/phosphoacceptor domain -containing protein [Rhodospirillales bacterium]